MDKIQKDFEKMFKEIFSDEVLRLINYPLLESLSFDYTDLFTIYKFRDPEIKALKQDCKNLVEIINNQAEIMKSKDIEIKKLREALTHPDYRPEE